MLGTRKRLGDLLVEAGKLTKDELKDMLSKQRGSGKKLGELIIEEGIITENEIMDVLEMQLGIKKVQMDALSIDKKAVKSIPENLAQKYILMPVDFQGNKLRVAMVDPLNIFAIDDVKIASGFDIIPLIAAKAEILMTIDRHYSSRNVEKMAEQLRSEITTKQVDTEEEDTIASNDVKNAPIVMFIDKIFSDAIKSRGSDIHIEPFDEYVKIRYRIDGALQEVSKLPKESLASIVTRIKIMANLNIAEKRIPQDGRIITKVDNKEIDLRISILPTVHGEKVVIRILDRENYLKDKKELGLSENDLEKIDRIVKSPYGIILVTGPTGSGKSTTLYTLLHELNTEDKNIITVEDPVEFMVEGVNQVNVNVKAGLTFASGLRSILRQDPDIIMIGEIRDDETAEIAVRSAITGHLVLSTIHTNDSASAVVRLTDMGIEPYLVATAISGIVAQRLVRRVCSKCKKAYKASSYEKSILGIAEESEVTLYKSEGCPSCGYKGYSGRIGVYEIMEISEEHRELIQNNASTEELRKASIRNGLSTLKDSCANLVKKGETTMEELLRIAFMKE